MKLYDDAVLDAAAAREAGDSAGAWKLADALLAEIPKTTDEDRIAAARAANSKVSVGGGVTPDRKKVSAQLTDYARRLADESIHTPAGKPYSVDTLDDLRDVAMAWPKEARYPQAAFRTHQEAKRPGMLDDIALKALCKYASGSGRKPPEIDADAWKSAKAMVDRLVERKARYTVSANALRAAVQRKNNTFTPEAAKTPEPVTATSVVAAAKSLPTQERTALARELAADPETRKDVETAVREVKSDELAAAHRRVMEEHGGKRKSGLGGGADDAPKHVVTEQPLAVLGVLIETEGFKDALPKVIRIVSDKRELLAEDDFEYLREWSTTMRQHLDTLDELLKLGTGLTDEAIEGLLKGE
jgi:hypothetical protein